jgi:putative transposase
LLDICHLDEAGIAMTLPNAYTWSPVGQTLWVPFEANCGRRLNLIGGYFSHGPLSGRFDYELYLSLPKSQAKKTKGQIVTLPEGVSQEEVGPIDAERLVAFLWRLAGRPRIYSSDWKRVRPLYIWLDNYSVHTGQAVKDALSALEAADVHLLYLPAYSPELSKIEPIWNDVKYHEMSERSFADVLKLRTAARAALDRKAIKLLAAAGKTTESLRAAA